MKSNANVTVTAKECRNNNERMIRKFCKKVKKERIIEKVKDRRRYKKYVIMTVKRKSVSLKIGKHKSRSGGLTAAGRKKYNAATGSNLKAPQPEGGPRKKSFCARMGGVKGPMKDSKGRPTRKALALRKWKC